MTAATAVVPVDATTSEPLRCVVCGVPAVMIDGRPVNPGPGAAPALCTGPPGTSTSTVGRPPRAHGPFIPGASP